MLSYYIALFSLLASINAAALPLVARGESEAPESGATDSAATESGASSETSAGGEATHYDVGAGPGACGENHTDDEMVVAMNQVDWSAQGGGEFWCGKTVTVTSKGGVSADATVVDLCPGCGKGSLDLSPALFQKINNGDLGAGRIPITFTSSGESAGAKPEAGGEASGEAGGEASGETAEETTEEEPEAEE